MSVGFGFSVGDFLAALRLVGTVIDALRESSHASSSFRSLLNELYALESVLLRVKRIDLDDRHKVGKLALRQAASQCQRTIDIFWKEIQKYQPHLQQSGTDSRTRDAWAKVKWAVCKKNNDLETFRAQIRGHTSSIEILLLTVQMEATAMDTRKQDSHNNSLASKIQDLSNHVMGKLSAISDSVGQCVQQGKALLESSAQIVQTNLRVFQIVHDIQLFILRIPGQVQRQQPVYLIDAFNKESLFHLEFIRSAEALLAVLKVNIKNSGCDPDIIDRGEFVIEESETQKSIDFTEPWDSCFYPGQRVAMSVIFKQQRTLKSSCPRCGKDHEESTGKEITWSVETILNWVPFARSHLHSVACGTIFRRIEEVIEDIQDTSQASHFGDKLDSGDVPERPLNSLPRALKKRKREEEDLLTNLRKFRRIQLISSIIDDCVNIIDNHSHKIDDLIASLGAGWKNIMTNPVVQDRARAYSHVIQKHYDLTDVVVMLEKESLSAYLVRAKDRGIQGYWLFHDSLQWCQLAGWSLDRTVRNINSGPIPRVEGERIYADDRFSDEERALQSRSIAGSPLPSIPSMVLNHWTCVRISAP